MASWKKGWIAAALAAPLVMLGVPALAQNTETWRANVIVSLTDPADGTTWVVERMSLTQWTSHEMCERLEGGSGAGRRLIRNIENLGTRRTATEQTPRVELVDLVCTRVR